jgi:hypothetical protein
LNAATPQPSSSPAPRFGQVPRGWNRCPSGCSISQRE